MHHQHQTQTQTSNMGISKDNQPKPLTPLFCLDGPVDLETGQSEQSWEENESIPSSSKCIPFASPIHLLVTVTRSHDESCHCRRPDIFSSYSSCSEIQPCSLVEQQNGPNQASDRRTIPHHKCTHTDWAMKLQCLHCIVTNVRHGPFVLLYYGLQILIFFNLLSLTACLNPPIPTHIGCLEVDADPSELAPGDRESSENEFGCDACESRKLTPPNIPSSAESLSSARDCCPLAESASKVVISSTSAGTNSEVSSLTSEGSIPPWSFEQVGKSLLDRDEVEDKPALTDDATIPSWSFVQLGESLYTSDISIEEENDETTHASDDSSIPAWSYVRVGDIL